LKSTGGVLQNLFALSVKETAWWCPAVTMVTGEYCYCCLVLAVDCTEPAWFINLSHISKIKITIFTGCDAVCFGRWIFGRKLLPRSYHGGWNLQERIKDFTSSSSSFKERLSNISAFYIILEFLDFLIFFVVNLVLGLTVFCFPFCLHVHSIFLCVQPFFHISHLYLKFLHFVALYILMCSWQFYLYIVWIWSVSLLVLTNISAAYRCFGIDKIMWNLNFMPRLASIHSVLCIVRISHTTWNWCNIPYYW
jgi:hypothetical protein